MFSKSRHYDTQQNWRKKIASHQQTQFKKLTKKPGKSPQQAANIEPAEMQLWDGAQWKFLLSHSTGTQFKPGWLTTLLFLNLLITTTMADKNSQTSAHAGKPAKVASSQKTQSSNHDPRKQFYLNDKNLLNLVKQKLVINYDPDHHKDYGVSKEKYTAVCIKMTESIQLNLPYSINTEVLKKMLAKQRLTINIMSRKKLEGETASYSYSIHTMNIAWDEHFSEERLRQSLQNEMHHATICAENGGKTESCLIMPKPEELNKIIEEGYKKINEYKKWFDSGKPNKEIENLSTKITAYEPAIWSVTLKKSDHEKLLSQPGVNVLADGRLFIPKGAFPADMSTFRQNDFYATLIKKSDKIVYEISFAKDNRVDAKVRALFLDTELRRVQYKQNHYGEFFNKNMANKVAEYASDVEMLPPALKQLFFPEFCKMFSEFHHVKEYCERPVIETSCKA